MEEKSFSLYSQTKGALRQQRLSSLPCLCALHGASCLKLVLFPQVFHYLSLSILTIFLVEVGFKVFVYGREFFYHKFEVLDGIVVIVSFILDVVLIFLEHEFEAVGLLILLRLWRVARIINGGCRAGLDLPNFPELPGLCSFLKPNPRGVALAASSEFHLCCFPGWNVALTRLQFLWGSDNLLLVLVGCLRCMAARHIPLKNTP